MDLIPGVLSLRFTTNPGGAFSLFGGAAALFLVASVVAVVVIVLASRNLASVASAVSLGLLLGGALGNLTDRLTRGSGIDGAVVDLIDLHVWPVFNVADMAIVTGALLLVVTSFRRRDRDGSGSAPDTDGAA